MSGPSCCYCDEPATLLCDGLLGRIKADRPFKAPGAPNVIDTDRDDWRVTCDRPLCRRHARKVGVKHWCGPDGCAVDTVDLCRECTEPHGGPLVSEEAALALRRRRAMRATP